MLDSRYALKRESLGAGVLDVQVAERAEPKALRAMF